MKFITLLTLILSSAVTLGINAESLEYKEYVDGLELAYTELKDSSGLVDRGAIYSSDYIEATWYIPKNEELWDSGLNFLNYLYSNQGTLESLSPSEWILVAEKLLAMGEDMGAHVAWGNFVIKAKICNDIVNRVAAFSLDEPSQLSPDERQGLLQTLLNLRAQLPTKAAMLALAIRKYKIAPPVGFDIQRLDYVETDPSSDIANLSNKDFLRMLSREDREFLEKVSNDEVIDSRPITNFIELYQKPMPLIVAFLAKYREYSWDVYFRLSLLDSGNFDENTDWSSVEKDLVFEVLDESLKDSHEHWMGRWSKYSIRKEGGGRRFYIGYILRGGGMENYNRWARVSEEEYTSWEQHRMLFINGLK